MSVRGTYEGITAFNPYAMNDTLRVQVLEAGQDLHGERLGDVLFKASILTHAATDSSTGNVLQEALKKNHAQIQLLLGFERWHLHTQERLRLLKAQALYDVGVVKVFESLALDLKSFDGVYVSMIVPAAHRKRNRYLLHGDHLARRDVHREVHAPKVALPDQLTTYPLEDGCRARC
jgi:hypothetical protein